MTELSGHDADAHVIVEGSPYEQMRRVMARHLCGWISGHGAPVEHFLADADLIMEDAHRCGIRFSLVDQTSNATAGLIKVTYG